MNEEEFARRVLAHIANGGRPLKGYVIISPDDWDEPNQAKKRPQRNKQKLYISYSLDEWREMREGNDDE